MRSVLIAYATSEGHTRKIAQQIGKWIEEAGLHAQLADTADPPLDLALSNYDAVIVAGSIHIGKHQKTLTRFVKKNLTSLQQLPGAFVSCSASAGGKTEKNKSDAQACIDAFIKQTGWAPTVCLAVAGAVLYTKYNVLIRAVMKKISEKEGGPTDTSRDHELTNWAELRAFIDKFACEQLKGSQIAAALVAS